ncbi:MAG: hypothetical protein M0018_05140 [Nitrospiraceae bacterium]|nr:hypothetical protein [Nitrospiraceae bacterium]
MKKNSGKTSDLTALDYARLYLSKGFSIIPVARGTKKPALALWKE